jgi:hypothetical protein
MSESNPYSGDALGSGIRRGVPALASVQRDCHRLPMDISERLVLRFLHSYHGAEQNDRQYGHTRGLGILGSLAILRFRKPIRAFSMIAMREVGQSDRVECRYQVRLLAFLPARSRRRLKQDSRPHGTQSFGATHYDRITVGYLGWVACD